jgi:hypothetical protein
MTQSFFREAVSVFGAVFKVSVFELSQSLAALGCVFMTQSFFRGAVSVFGFQLSAFGQKSHQDALAQDGKRCPVKLGRPLQHRCRAVSFTLAAACGCVTSSTAGARACACLARGPAAGVFTSSTAGFSRSSDLMGFWGFQAFSTIMLSGLQISWASGRSKSGPNSLSRC